MLYALINGQKELATPKIIGKCPLCDRNVIPKCGEINIWHWSHEKKENCDTWYESETNWHKSWKLAFGKEQCEVSICRNEIRHRADIQTSKGIVIELQNSPILMQTIKKREEFYGEKMIWIINGKNFKNNVRLYPIDEYVIKKKSWLGTYIQRIKLDSSESINQEKKNYDKNFLWDFPKRTWANAARPIFIDFGNSELFWVKNGMGTNRGYGTLIHKSIFLKKYNGNIDLLNTLIDSGEY